MKKIFLITTSILLSAICFAQSPDKLSYQAVVRNADGDLVTSVVGMRISILQGTNPSTATSVYTETLTPTPNSNGLVSVEFGGGTGWDAISWASGTFFLQTEIDIDNNSSYDIVGSTQLLSVPYALHASTVENITETDPQYTAWDKDYADLTNTPTTITAEQATAIIDNTAKMSYNTTDSLKLDGIEAGAEVNVQADWDAISGDAQILNKPDLSIYATKNMANEKITNLANPTELTDAVTKSYVDSLFSMLGMLEDFLIDQGAYVLEDYDGNEYSVVRIGDQVWMGENLTTTTYANGEPITQITDTSTIPNGADDEWMILTDTSRVYCWYNDNISNQATYGAMYTYAAATNNDTSGTNVQGVCPTGWHLPSLAEWLELETFVTNEIGAAGTVLKNDTGWDASGNGTNDYQFSALPGGERSEYDGHSRNAGAIGRWWTSTQYDATTAHHIHMGYASATVADDTSTKIIGRSVRCIRNE